MTKKHMDANTHLSLYNVYISVFVPFIYPVTPLFLYIFANLNILI